MANVATPVETESKSKTWAWVDDLQNKVDAFSENAEKVGGSIEKVGSVISTLFGGTKSAAPEKVATGNNLYDILPYVAIGGIVAMILK